MLLVVDQGNSDVVFGLHDGQDWIAEWRTPTTDKNQSAYQVLMRQWLLEAGINPSNVNQAIISSVVPDQRTTVIDFVTNLFAFKPVVLNQQLYQKLGLELNSPHEIGSDLVANAMAAAHMFPDSCSIVVDFGTALTLTSVSGRKILGVSIAPGLKTAVSSLFSHTAQLPEVPLEVPDSLLGKNTIHAIQSGVLHGYVGLVKHLVKKTRDELPGTCKVLATGGLSKVLEPLQDEFDYVDKRLTLNGLRVINHYLNP